MFVWHPPPLFFLKRQDFLGLFGKVEVLLESICLAVPLSAQKPQGMWAVRQNLCCGPPSLLFLAAGRRVQVESRWGLCHLWLFHTCFLIRKEESGQKSLSVIQHSAQRLLLETELSFFKIQFVCFRVVYMYMYWSLCLTEQTGNVA